MKELESLTQSMPEFKGKLLLSEPMSAHTSYRIGGPADLYAVPRDVADLQMLVKGCADCSIPLFVVGDGTNLLVADKGIRGAVVQLGTGFGRVRVKGEDVTAGAAVKISRLLRETIGRGLAGLEGLAGVPGTVGGAVYMNAGTRHGYISDSLSSISAVDRNGELVTFNKSDLGMGYRESKVRELGIIVADVKFELTKADPEVINDLVESRVQRRKETQPPGVGTCGSVFKNPMDGHAAQLIETIGAKGMQIGGARVSGKHANFIENTGTASAADVKELMEKLIILVQEHCGVVLDPEVQIVGEW